MSLQKILLGLLKYRPMTGYDIKRWLSNSNIWDADISHIYRHLSTLGSKGYATSQIEEQGGRPDRKVYTITGEGIKEFNNWLVKFPPSSVSLDELSLKIFFGSQLPLEEIKYQLETFIRRTVEEKESFIDTIMIFEKYANEISLPHEFFFWKLALKKKYLLTEASIKWAKECLRDLNMNSIHAKQ